MIVIAYLFALMKLAEAGSLLECERVWTSKDGGPTDVPSVGCGKHEVFTDPDLVRRGYADRMTWYDVVCTPDGCWR